MNAATGSTMAGATLRELLLESAVPSELRVAGLALDSREIRPGDVFLALRGTVHDGLAYIEDAARLGAVAVLAEADRKIPDASLPVIPVEDLGARAGSIAARFYGDPSAELGVIGVTGTNGKTTCTQLIAQALGLCGRPCGVIGTLGAGFPGQLDRTSHTTPDAVRLQRLLAELRTQGAAHVAMEISSHALSMGRVDAVRVDTAVFTNLTHDHLDFHGNIAEYGAAKARLFHHEGLRRAVLNIDDPFGERLSREISPAVSVLRCSTESAAAEVYARQARFGTDGIRAMVHTPWGQGELAVPLMGRFNLENTLGVLAVLGMQGVGLDTALDALRRVAPVPGRMQRIGEGRGPLVVVDYAHTPDALEQALRALRAHCAGRLWCVFGCGGDRDRSKRPLMGRLAWEHADVVVVTSDNPRSEDPGAIVVEICAGIPPEGATREADRRLAIEYAIGAADAPDCVLIAGKGHEDYQEANGVRTPFDDALVALAALARRGAAT